MTYEQPNCPPKKGKKKVAALLIAIGSGLATLIAATAIVWAVANQTTPLEKTVSAILPDLSTLEVEQGEVRVQGTLGEDILCSSGTVPQGFRPLPFDIVAAQSEKGEMYIKGSVGFEDDPADVVLMSGDEQLYLSSSLMGDRTLGLAAKDAEDIKDQLRESLFAPDSGSRYALPQEQFDSLLEMLTDETDEDLSAADQIKLNKAMKRILRRMESILEEQLEDETRKKTEVSLYDGKAEATLYTYTFSAGLVDALLAGLRAEMTEHDDLRTVVELLGKENGAATKLQVSGLSASRLATGDTAEAAQGSDTWEAFCETLEDALKSIEKSVADEPFKVRLVYAVRGGYLVRAEVVLTHLGENGEAYTNSVGRVWQESIVCLFCKDPSEDPSFSITYKEQSDPGTLYQKEGKTYLTVNMVYTKENDGEAYQLDLKTCQYEGSHQTQLWHSVYFARKGDKTTGTYDLAYEYTVGESTRNSDSFSKIPVLKANAGGTYRFGKNESTLTFDRYGFYMRGDKIVRYDVDDSPVELTWKPTPTIPESPANATPLLGMTETELDELLTTVNENYRRKATALRQATGLSVFEPSASVTFGSELATVGNSTSTSCKAYAVDGESGLVYLASSKYVNGLPGGEVKALDPKTGSYLKPIYKGDDEPRALSICGDKIAVAFMGTNKQAFRVEIYHKETGERLDVIYPYGENNRDGSVPLQGIYLLPNHLLVSYKGKLSKIDLETKKRVIPSYHLTGAQYLRNDKADTLMVYGKIEVEAGQKDPKQYAVYWVDMTKGTSKHKIVVDSSAKVYLANDYVCIRYSRWDIRYYDMEGNSVDVTASLNASVFKSAEYPIAIDSRYEFFEDDGLRVFDKNGYHMEDMGVSLHRVYEIGDGEYIVTVLPDEKHSWIESLFYVHIESSMELIPIPAR